MQYAIPTIVPTAREIARAADRKLNQPNGIRMSLMLSSEVTGLHTPEQMLLVVARTLGMDPAEYTRKCRARDTVELRFIASRLLRIYYPGITLKRISGFFGGQDHSSVINGLERAQDLLHTRDDAFTRKYEKAQRAVRLWLRTDLQLNYLPPTA